MARVSFLYAPPISCGYGHRSRCIALGEAFTNLGHEVFDDLRYRNGDIVVVDGPIWEFPADVFMVAIDDYGNRHLGNYGSKYLGSCDVIVNQNIHPLSLMGGDLYPGIKRKIIGLEYFMRQGIFCGQRVYDGGYTFIVPGSSGLISHEFAKNLRGYGVEYIIGEDMSQVAFAGKMAGATVVVSAASVSALESCSLGKPTLIIQTADNQFYLYHSLIASGAALPFTPENYLWLLSDRAARQKLGEMARSVVPTDGAEWVAKKILEFYENRDYR